MLLKIQILCNIGIIILFFSYMRQLNFSKEFNKDKYTDKQFNRLIYFIIDGVRYDAIVKQDKQNYYYNNFDFNYSKYHRTFLSISEAPTVTSKKVYSLVSGKFFNQLDTLFAFYHSAVYGDSLLKQCGDFYFYGDKTWNQTFELHGNCICIDPYSKNIKKHDENRCTPILFQNFNKYTNHFIHYIQSDSLGHKYDSVQTEEMQKVLRKYNDIVRQIYDKMSKDTLLVLLSDHGVTDKGEHGGSSSLEFGSFVTFISKKPIKTYDKKIYFTKKEKRLAATMGQKFKTKEVIFQKDIINTLCYLLGYAIPSNSSASFIEEFVPVSAHKKSIIVKENLLRLNNIRYSQQNMDDVTYSRFLSQTLQDEMGKINFIGITIAFLVFFYCMHQSIETLTIQKLFCLIFSFKDSISYFFFYKRDLFLCFMFLLFSPSLKNLSLVIFYLKHGKIGHFENYRELMNIEKKLESISYLIPIGVVVYRCIKTKEILKLIEVFLPYIFKHFFSVSNLDLILNFQSPYSLFAIFFKPYFAANILLLQFIDIVPLKIISSCILKINSDDLSNLEEQNSGIKFVLLCLITHIYNLDMRISQIDYDIAYKFTDDVDYPLVILGAFVYFVLPRYMIMKRFKNTPFDIFVCSTMILVSTITAIVITESITWMDFYSYRFAFLLVSVLIDNFIQIFFEITNYIFK
ncbi:hypothetical protein NUSPORA_00371 [Nucleospora cyclopteri]